MFKLNTAIPHKGENVREYILRMQHHMSLQHEISLKQVS